MLFYFHHSFSLHHLLQPYCFLLIWLFFSCYIFSFPFNFKAFIHQHCSFVLQRINHFSFLIFAILLAYFNFSHPLLHSLLSCAFLNMTDYLTLTNSSLNWDTILQCFTVFVYHSHFITLLWVLRIFQWNFHFLLYRFYCRRLYPFFHALIRFFPLFLEIYINSCYFLHCIHNSHLSWFYWILNLV